MGFRRNDRSRRFDPSGVYGEFLQLAKKHSNKGWT
jgi:hypothetical protein